MLFFVSKFNFVYIQTQAIIHDWIQAINGAVKLFKELYGLLCEWQKAIVCVCIIQFGLRWTNISSIFAVP